MIYKKSILVQLLCKRVACCSSNRLFCRNSHKVHGVYNIGQPSMQAQHLFGKVSGRISYCKLSPIMWNSADSSFGTLNENASENHSSLTSSEMLNFSNVLDIEALSNEVMLENKMHKLSALDSVPNIEFIDNLAPFIGPTFNMAVHVNNSPTLQELVKLGVNLSTLERDSYKARFILSLKFDEDVKPFLLFLHSLQVPPEEWGQMITMNPFLVTEDQDILLRRVEYLKSKSFSTEAIASIVATYPSWLSKSIVTVDGRLGFLQRQFGLTGENVRTVVTKLPSLVFFEQMKIVENQFIVHEEFGFTKDQVKELFVQIPVFFRKKTDNVKSKLSLVTKKMALSIETVMRFPGVLTSKGFILESRHFFLKSLGRAQYDPTRANFVCPETFAQVTDPKFAVEVARSSLAAYHTFLKTV